LGLTASPSGSEDKIAEVCKNLGITAIEHRTDEDKDVKPYIQPIEVEWRRVKPRLTVFIRAVDPSFNRNVSLSAMVNAQWKDVEEFSIIFL